PTWPGACRGSLGRLLRPGPGRPLSALARGQLAAETGALVLRHLLLDEGEHLVLLLTHVMLDTLLQRRHRGAEPLVVGERGTGFLYAVLDRSVLALRLVEHLVETLVAQGADGRIEGALFDARMHVELATDLLGGRPPLARRGRVAGEALHHSGEPTAVVEALEQCRDLRVVFFQEVDGVHENC